MNPLESERKLQKLLSEGAILSSTGSLETKKEVLKTTAVKRTAVQWSILAPGCFVPAGDTIQTIPAGYYEAKYSDNVGYFLQQFEVNTTNLLRFDNSASGKVIEEIASFWARKDLYAQFNTPFKRGILLWGPPGGGKSSVIRIIANDLINNHNGIILNWTGLYYFELAYDMIRSVEPDKPIILLMEDLDSIMEDYERELTNILDGIKRYENIVFVATTNYPERLSPRIVNRPGRFDKKFEIGALDAASRKILLENFIPANLLPTINLDQWVRDTEDMSIAHIKELVIAVMVIGDDYETTIQLLKTINGVLS